MSCLVIFVFMHPSFLIGQILLARAALGEIHEDPPTEILTPAKLLTSKKLEALKTHLRRSIVSWLMVE